ncbi:MAG: hypothetical protein HY898_21270 [Deltaproteobacteria bacterium]|nr:hypothetical protein [Deltaproteobacteria bacterium]
MGIEYACDVVGTGDFRSAISSGLHDDPCVELLPSSDACLIKLRFRETPRREEWPEDVDVTFEPMRIAVVFHSATRQQRQYLVQLLENLLLEAGCSGKLVEQ